MNNTITKIAVIGMGTNLGDRKANLSEAAEALSLLPGTRVLRTSGVYETSPVGYAAQGDFLNSVAELETSLSPHALLGACLGIEAAMGRRRSFKNGPRLIDLDILLYEGCTSEEPELYIPHRELKKRAFAVVPLLKLYPDGCFFDFCFDLSKCDNNDRLTLISDSLV